VNYYESSIDYDEEMLRRVSCIGRSKVSSKEISAKDWQVGFCQVPMQESWDKSERIGPVSR